MTTARALITTAMQKIGAVTKNESPSADEINDGLSVLNALLSSYANDSLLTYARYVESFPLTVGDGEYTIGTGGDFSTTRPTYIVAAYLRKDNVDYPLDMISDEIYASIGDKLTRSIPIFLNFDNNYALAKIRLYPVPSDTYTLYLVSEKPLSALDLDTVITLPDGWERMLVHNLAVEIAPEYGQEIAASVYEIAKESKTLIRRNTLKNRTMDVQPSVTFSRFSTTGMFR